MFEEHSTTDLDNQSGITFQDITEFSLKHFLLLFSITCLTSLIAILFSYTVTPVFQAEVVAVSGGSVSGRNRTIPSSVSGIASLAGITVPSSGDDDVLMSIAIAESKKFDCDFNVEWELMSL